MNDRDERQVRLEKCEDWLASGRAYPNDMKGRVSIRVCLEAGVGSDEHRLAGRVMLKRDMGKSCFLTLEDASGRMQLYARQDVLGDVFERLVLALDLGDVIDVRGTVFMTKTQELTLRVTEMRLLAKSLNPFPDKFHGVTDRELCYRQRYVDLMVNPETRQRFLKRSALIEAVRAFLRDRAYLEVETPMLHPLAGGALARPFTTHHHALDMELFLRIAPELYLKRLLVGGFERVFEINRNFRNEGMSTRHNPEFTMIEFYQAYATVEDMLVLTEELMRSVVLSVCGSLQISYQGRALDFSKPFKKISLIDAVDAYAPELAACSDQALRAWLADRDLDHTGATRMHLYLEVFEKLIEKDLFEPTFVVCYPTVVSPLARCNDQDPSFVDRFEFFMGGYEVANAFSELNDPLDQARRFEAQMRAKIEGAEETMPYDEDYIQALSYGMPPAAGEGIGIDRLAMILTDAASIKDVILFPHMKPVASTHPA